MSVTQSHKNPGRWSFGCRPEDWFRCGRKSGQIPSGTELFIVGYTYRSSDNPTLFDVSVRDRSGKVYEIPDEDASWFFVMADA